ncbi:MAG: FAD:protein FMN transferase [Bacteroidota bacterium]|nr:FAD:protein FMN transferase [Bacteroidota bacterium]
MLHFQYSQKNPSVPIAYASFYAMHTRMEIIFPGLTEEKSRRLTNLIYQNTLQLEEWLNRFDPHSKLSILNHAAGIRPLKIDDEMFEIMEYCLSYYERTNGFFDVGINSLSPQPFLKEKFTLDTSSKTVSFVHPDIRIDLGGFAKGYTIQKVEILLKEEQVENCLVNFGNSSILALGHHPYGDSWRLGVEHPFRKGESIQVFDLRDQALSVSGNVPQHPEHIISPETHQVITGLSMISVVGKSGLTAEVLSTALFAGNENERIQILTNFPEYKANSIFYSEEGISIINPIMKKTEQWIQKTSVEETF